MKKIPLYQSVNGRGGLHYKGPYAAIQMMLAWGMAIISGSIILRLHIGGEGNTIVGVI